MLSLDVGLGEDEGVVGVDCSVGDPVLLGGHWGTVDDKLLGFFVVVGSRFHFYGVVAVAEFCQAETASYVQTVNLVEYPAVPVGVESHDGTSEEVVVHCELGGGGSGDGAYHLMGSENVGGVVEEVSDGYDAWPGDLRQLPVGDIPVSGEGNVELGSPYLVPEDLEPLGLLLVSVVEEQSLQVLHVWYGMM